MTVSFHLIRKRYSTVRLYKFRHDGELNWKDHKKLITKLITKSFYNFMSVKRVVLRHRVGWEGGSRRMKELAEELKRVGRASVHATFSAIESQLLRPCLEACLAEEEGSSGSRAAGCGWALLGAARLALVSPPQGIDPAAKYAFKRAHLLRLVSSEILPRLQVPPSFLFRAGSCVSKKG